MQSSTGNQQCIAHIKQLIAGRQDGLISFYEYMNACLYLDPHGYYRSDRVKIGKAGDFYTSAALGGLLAEMVAAFFLRVMDAHLRAGETLTFVEWGGGTGQFAESFLAALQSADEQAYARTRYVMIETSALHRQLQAQQLTAHEGMVGWLTAAEWLTLDSGPATLIFSNELLDAFPVERLRKTADGWHRMMVGYDEPTETFHGVERPLELTFDGQVHDYGTALLSYVRRYGVQASVGQWLEVNLDALDWLASIGGRLADKAWLLTIDYGDLAEELTGPHRQNGTFLCYHRHQASDRPFEHVGEQDMTAHVNFSALMDKGADCGLRTVSYQTQRDFLCEQGILEKLQDTLHVRDPFHPLVKRNRSIRQLLFSDQMSELFKVLIQQK